MRPQDLTQETWRGLTANKARSALTMLGIVIGIGAVIAMNAIIGGVSKVQLEMFGANAARIIKITLTGIDNFTIDDVQELAANVPGYEYVMGYAEGDGTILADKRTLKAKVIGSDRRYCDAHGFQFLSGSGFSEEDEKRGSQVVVISRDGAKVLFGSEDANVVGKSVNINSAEYRILGVVNKLDDYGVESYFSDTVYVFMPLATANARIIGHQNLTAAEGLVSSADLTESTSSRTQAYLQERYKLGDSDDIGATRTASVSTNKELLDQVNSSVRSFQAIAVTVSAVSLVVGGIGIMNMMLTNVTERIREIGLRKALGAKRSDITSQFMLESVCLCVVGGIIGVIAGLLGSFALMGIVGRDLASQMSFGVESTSVQPVIDASSIVNAVLVCVVTGVVFGWYPARRASRLDPVESLNHQ